MYPAKVGERLRLVIFANGTTNETVHKEKLINIFPFHDNKNIKNI